MNKAWRGFTLIEALVALLVLSIGFSGLYFWFVGFGAMAKHDRLRVEMLQQLRLESERCVAFPQAVTDSEWTLHMGVDSFSMQRSVLDSNDLEHIADSLALELQAHRQFVERPREVLLRIRALQINPIPPQQLFLVVGGIVHVAP